MNTNLLCRNDSCLKRLAFSSSPSVIFLSRSVSFHITGHSWSGKTNCEIKQDIAGVKCNSSDVRIINNCGLIILNSIIISPAHPRNMQHYVIFNHCRMFVTHGGCFTVLAHYEKDKKVKMLTKEVNFLPLLQKCFSCTSSITCGKEE